MPEFDKVINIHYGEIALKGKNRPFFEKMLMDSIKAALSEAGAYKTEKKESRILVHIKPDEDEKRILGLMARIFGIEWYSCAILTSNHMDEIKKAVFMLAELEKDRSLKLLVSRSDKNFRMTSPEIGKEIGTELERNGVAIDLRNPQRTISIEILKDSALISGEKHNGLGGLPAGSSGKLLSLLSGGIDSPVASWLMMKRGCSVDFIHVHSFANSKDAEESKIMELARKLKGYCPAQIRIFLVPYTEFYKLSFKLPPKSELVIFRRFILKMANRLAQEYGYLGLVSGDSVGQVASQTLENLMATNEASALLVYRPLAAYNKQEIIYLAKKIGTYELSVQEYKDCCSLVAQKHPGTKSKLDRIKEIELDANMDEVIEKTLKETKTRVI